MELTIVSTDCFSDLELAASRRWWSVHTEKWGEATIKGKQSQVNNRGDSFLTQLGIFWCAEVGRQVLTMPFLFSSIPSVEPSKGEIWTRARASHFHFSFIPFGTPDKTFPIEGLRELFGDRWSRYLSHFTAPLMVFAPAKLETSEWVEILDRLT